MHIIKPYPGYIRGLKPTPEEAFNSRRRFLQQLGLASICGMLPMAGCAFETPAGSGSSVREIDPATGTENLKSKHGDLYPAKRNEKYVLDRPVTKENAASRYNNFYEFTTDKNRVWQLAEKLSIAPWKVEVTGLVENPLSVDVDELVRMLPLEERLYRHRCVETWAMAVPWTGFPLAELLRKAQPKSSATHVRFVSFLRPDETPGQAGDTSSPWPYQEGLTLAEAMNDLPLMVTGIYGHELPKQHGAPLRLVTPWKYGFKSIKSIQRIEVVNRQPATFWNTLIPQEYDFTANVNPKKPHPRWSQGEEWWIPSGERHPTLPYNGYGESVAKLYS
jgi:sulfoxide reductase catalytic subunit YedY